MNNTCTLESSDPLHYTAPAITVVVLTTGKRASLRGAIDGVYRQDYRPLHLLVLVDGDHPISPIGAPPNGISVRTITVPRESEPRGRAETLSHVAHLRNIAVALVQTPLLAFLDDDNLWAIEHLSSLHAAMSKVSASAAHCWRRMVAPDGGHVALTSYPWLPAGLPLERQAFAACRAAGILREGDCVLRDTMLAPNGLQAGIVDMGSWLLKKSALDGFRFPERFTARDIAEGAGADDALIAFFHRGNVLCATSERATLDYRLGGFSNQENELDIRDRNIALSRLDIQERRTELRSMPRFVLVELSRFCNLSCGMCRTRGSVSKAETMSDETFTRVEAELLPFADSAVWD